MTAVPKEIEDCLRAGDRWGIEFTVRAYFEQDRRDEVIETLRKERVELQARVGRLEGEKADLQASVNLGLPRQNKKGTGAHYSGRIKRLGEARADCMAVLIEASARDFASGMTTDQVAQRVKEMRDWQHSPYPEDLAHSLGGRLSELQGLGWVRSETNTVVLKDEAEGKFRTDGSTQRWYLTETGRHIENPTPDMNPQDILGSYAEAKA